MPLWLLRLPVCVNCWECVYMELGASHSDLLPNVRAPIATRRATTPVPVWGHYKDFLVLSLHFPAASDIPLCVPPLCFCTRAAGNCGRRTTSRADVHLFLCFSSPLRSAAVWSWDWAACVGRSADPVAACWTLDVVFSPSRFSHSSRRWWWRPTRGGMHEFFCRLFNCRLFTNDTASKDWHEFPHADESLSWVE